MSAPLLFRWREAFSSQAGPHPTTRLILWTLSAHMDPDGGNCYPGMRLLADETGLSKRAIINRIQEADGTWVKVRKRAGGKRGGVYHEYQPLIPPKAVNEVHHLDPESGERASPLRGDGREESGEPGSPVPSESGERGSPVREGVENSKAVNLMHESGEHDDKKAVNEVHLRSSRSSPGSTSAGSSLRSSPGASAGADDPEPDDEDAGDDLDWDDFARWMRTTGCPKYLYQGETPHGPRGVSDEWEIGRDLSIARMLQVQGHPLWLIREVVKRVPSLGIEPPVTMRVLWKDGERQHWSVLAGQALKEQEQSDYVDSTRVRVEVNAT